MQNSENVRGIPYQVYVYRYLTTQTKQPGGRREFIANFLMRRDIPAFIEMGGLGEGRFRLEVRDRNRVLIGVQMVLVGEAAQQHRVRPRPQGLPVRPAPQPLNWPGSAPQRVIQPSALQQGAEAKMTRSAPGGAPGQADSRIGATPGRIPTSTAIAQDKPTPPPRSANPIRNAKAQIRYFKELILWEKAHGNSAVTLGKLRQSFRGWKAHLEKLRLEKAARTSG